jgi:hypothetical protein
VNETHNDGIRVPESGATYSDSNLMGGYYRRFNRTKHQYKKRKLFKRNKTRKTRKNLRKANRTR